MRWEGVSLPLAHFGDLSIPMGVLLGDVNFTRGVDGNDVSAVQSHTRQPVNNMTFQYDVTANGLIDGNDVSTTQGQTRTSFPQPPTSTFMLKTETTKKYPNHLRS